MSRTCNECVLVYSFRFGLQPIDSSKYRLSATRRSSKWPKKRGNCTLIVATPYKELRNQREDEGSDIRQYDQGIKAKKNAVTAMNEIEEIDSLIILVVAQLSSELRFIVLVSSSMSAAYSVPNHRFWQWG